MGPQLNLNIEPQQEEVMQMDLNQPAEQNGEDLQKVIINPAQPMVQDDFLELNDLVGDQAQVIEEEM